MAPSPTSPAARAVGQIEKAHKTFQLNALKTLHPELQGADLAFAMGRESARDASYVQRMRARVGARVDALQNAQLEPAERSRRMDTMMRSERRFLAQHIEAAGWRMSSEADMARLKGAGERGAVWVKDPTKKTHTADCERMHGRWWPWSVLDRVNPANRHTGCGCKLKSREQATAEGIKVRMGRRSDVVRREIDQQPLREARRRRKAKLAPHDFTTFHPLFGAGRTWHPDEHPRDSAGRFIRVFGRLPQTKPFHDDLHAYQDAVAMGDRHGMEVHFGRLFDRARKLPNPTLKKADARRVRTKKEDQIRDRRDALQTLQRMKRSVSNPLDQRVPTGSQVSVGGRHTEPPSEPVTTPVGLSVHSDGILDSWTRYGTYGWLLSRGATSDQTAADLRRSRLHQVTDTDGGYFIETKPGLPDHQARALARHMERRANHWRNRRAADERELLHDDRPLDVGLDEREVRTGTELERLPGITDEEIGVAGELAARDVRDALQGLGRIPADDDRLVLPAGHDEDPQAPLDVIADGLGIESKSYAMRDLTLGATAPTPSITAWQTERKRAAAQRGVVLVPGPNRSDPLLGLGERRLGSAAQEVFDAEQGTQQLRNQAQAQGLRGALMTNFVDTDANVVHVFFHEYPDEESAFRSAPRVPAAATQALADGGHRNAEGTWVPLAPGQLWAPAGGPQSGDLSRGTMYVGTFQLRYNPAAEAGKKLTASEIVDRSSKPQVSLDQRATGRKVRAQGKRRKPKTKAKRATVREKALAHEDRIRDLSAREMTQGQIAAALGITQPTLSRWMAELGIQPGRGRRTDLKGRRPGDQNVA